MENMKRELDREIVRKLNKPNPSMKDLADIMKHVIEHMWSEERLAEYITQVHNALCAQCPKCRENSGKMSGKLIALIGALVTAVVTLSGVICKMAMGG